MNLPPAPNGLHNRWNLGLRWGFCNKVDCVVRDNLQKCSSCLVAVYCSAGHQRAHWPEHKSTCKLIKTTREELAQEEVALRALPGDMFMPPNPFETERGSFWYWKPTRPYMKARFNVISTLLNMKTGEAVELALDHSFETLHLNCADNQGVRSTVPGLFLRLGRDQEAYDFIKWYAVTGAVSSYEWGNPESPFLDLHDQDVFERFDDFVAKVYDTSMLVCLTNLKIRLMLDLQMLQRESRKPGQRNAGYDKKMEWVREDAMTDQLYKRRDLVERSQWTDLIDDLDDQIKKLVKLVNERNEHYWPALKAPDRWAAAYPTIYIPGSPQEINIVFRQTWYTWSECPAAFEVVKRYARI
ncbi:hypothetical protein GGR54DRAFT_592605 [Hypoxylon sp. NC1633]|nr:hypothetical protein GGR54DRAFT_592605 [Hypoxylon sp. NC1633]